MSGVAGSRDEEVVESCRCYKQEAQLRSCGHGIPERPAGYGNAVPLVPLFRSVYQQIPCRVYTMRRLTLIEIMSPGDHALH